MAGVWKCVACALALAVSEASPLQASDTTFVSEGARVRVFPSVEGTEPVIGTVVDVALDTFIVLSEREEVLSYHDSKLSKIEVSEGEKKKTLLGFGVGFGVGLAAGFAICNADKDAHTCGSEADLLGDLTGVVILMTAALGGSVGAIVGSFIKTERWQKATLSASPPVALNVGKDGSMGLVFSLRL